MIPNLDDYILNCHDFSAGGLDGYHLNHKRQFPYIWWRTCVVYDAQTVIYLQKMWCALSCKWHDEKSCFDTGETPLVRNYGRTISNGLKLSLRVARTVHEIYWQCNKQCSHAIWDLCFFAFVYHANNIIFKHFSDSSVSYKNGTILTDTYRQLINRYFMIITCAMFM